MFFCAICVYLRRNLRAVWPPNASFYASSTCVHLRLLAGPFDQGLRLIFYWSKACICLMTNCGHPMVTGGQECKINFLFRPSSISFCTYLLPPNLAQTVSHSSLFVPFHHRTAYFCREVCRLTALLCWRRVTYSYIIS